MVLVPRTFNFFSGLGFNRWAKFFGHTEFPKCVLRKKDHFKAADL